MASQCSVTVLLSAELAYAFDEVALVAAVDTALGTLLGVAHSQLAKAKDSGAGTVSTG